MATHARADQDYPAVEVTVLPRYAVQLPFELPRPTDFVPGQPETWPRVTGRTEYVGGRLLYMPPCGDEQQAVATDIVTELNVWRRQHGEFFVGGNEAGMMLGGDVRGADAAVWRRADVLPLTGGFPRTAPVLAVEVAGREDTVEALEQKARWYLDHGVEVVWIAIPRTRTVRVLTRDGAREHGAGERLSPHPSLPELSPNVEDLFSQLPPRSSP